MEQMVLAVFFMLEHMELPFVISYEFAFHLMHIPNGGYRIEFRIEEPSYD